MADSVNPRTKMLSGVESNNGQAVVYVMSRDQRAVDNYALLAAQADASVRNLPLIVLFNVYPTSGVRARQHYEFMVEGLKEVEQSLVDKNIPFAVFGESTQIDALNILDEQLPLAAIYFDYSPLHRPRTERDKAVERFDVPVHVVDTHNIVPVWRASDKREYAARTIRPKLHKLAEDFLEEPPELKSQSAVNVSIDSITLDDALQQVQAEKRDNLEIAFSAGQSAAIDRLHEFIDSELRDYHTQRNDPAVDGLSNLSPYFHFGQLSPLRAVLEVEQAAQVDHALREGADTFIEEAFIRRELSDNFCEYESNYRSLDAASEWARETLKKHRSDPREYIYSFEQLEQAQTHDPAWNAAQHQMTTSGKMHGYMRMYWAKKILEWTEHPEQALSWAIKLNDMYEIDGNDPNGYVGCLWSIAGIHDRGWTEREVFGKIRYMNLNGLKRKFDIETYIARWTDSHQQNLDL